MAEPTGLPDPYIDEHHHDHGARFPQEPRRAGRLRIAFLITSATMVTGAVCDPPVVRDVHPVHVWQLTGGSCIANLHAVLAGDSPDAAIRAVRELLHARHAIDYVTGQLDGVACATSCPHDSDLA